jgi:hypothetical protein
VIITRDYFLFQRKSTLVTRRGRVPWKRLSRIPVRGLSFLSVPLGDCISQCNATSPLDTAGVCWWTQGAHCLEPPRGKPTQSPSCTSYWVLGQGDQLPVMLTYLSYITLVQLSHRRSKFPFLST